MPSKETVNQLSDIARVCLERVQLWESRHVNPNEVRDVSYFYSAFPGEHIEDYQLLEALDELRAEGYISVNYPDVENDPEGFIVRTTDREEIYAAIR